MISTKNIRPNSAFGRVLLMGELLFLFSFHIFSLIINRAPLGLISETSLYFLFIPLLVLFLSALPLSLLRRAQKRIPTQVFIAIQAIISLLCVVALLIILLSEDYGESGWAYRIYFLIFCLVNVLVTYSPKVTRRFKTKELIGVLALFPVIGAILPVLVNPLRFFMVLGVFHLVQLGLLVQEYKFDKDSEYKDVLFDATLDVSETQKSKADEKQSGIDLILNLQVLALYIFLLSALLVVLDRLAGFYDVWGSPEVFYPMYASIFYNPWFLTGIVIGIVLMRISKQVLSITALALFFIFGTSTNSVLVHLAVGYFCYRILIGLVITKNTWRVLLAPFFFIFMILGITLVLLYDPFIAIELQNQILQGLFTGAWSTFGIFVAIYLLRRYLSLELLVFKPKKSEKEEEK